MPPKKRTKKSKGKASKCKCSNHIQNTRVSVGGGGGGGGAPIVYATYAPPPPQMQTSMPYELGRGFAPEKFERTPFNEHGVNVQGGYASNAPQAHSDMSLLEKFFHDEAAANKPPSYAGSAAQMSEGPGPTASMHSESSVNNRAMSTSSITDHLRSRSVHPTDIIGGPSSF